MRKARFQKQLTIAIPPEDFEQIQKITDNRQISIAEWVRDAVAAVLEEHKKQDPLRF